MKIEIDLPEDLDWLKEILASAYDGAERYLTAADTDPKWGSGYFAGVKELIHVTENRYAEMAEESRRRYELKPAPEPEEVRLENLGMRG